MRSRPISRLIEGPHADSASVRPRNAHRSIGRWCAALLVVLAGLLGTTLTAASRPTSAGCDLLHIGRLGLDRCVVGGGQSQIDAGNVVRVDSLSNSTVHWLGGHRTSHGGTFGSLTGLRIGDDVEYRGRTYAVIDHRVINRFDPGPVLDWRYSITPSVVLQTSKSATYVYVWRAVAVDRPAPAPTPEPPPPPPRPERPRIDLLGTDTAAVGAAQPVTIVEPVPVADTRATSSIGPGERRVFAVPDDVGIPSNATTVFVNTVAYGHGGRGYLTATSCSGPVAEVANLNWSDRIAVSSIIAASVERGQFCLQSSSAVDVVVEIVGYVSPSSELGLQAVTPRRLLDTRASGEVAIAAGTPRRIELTSSLGRGHPGAAQVTVAGIGPSSAELWVHHCDAASGGTPSVVMRRGAPVANSALVPLDEDGGFCVTTGARAHVVVDLTGRFIEGAARFQAMHPIRLVDTRLSDAATTYVGPDRLHRQETAWFSIAGWRGLADTHATWLNVVSAQSDTVGFVTAWQCGETRPLASTQNPRGGAWVTSLTSVAGGPLACVFTQEPAHYVVDLVGVWID